MTTAIQGRRPQSGFRSELTYLFPESSRFHVDKSKIQYDDEGLRFVTYAVSARTLRKWVVQLRETWCPPSSYSGNSRSSRVIVDGTSGLGGNVIAFAKSEAFDHVVAVELDRVRFECLVNNVALYRLSKYVRCINGDFVDWFVREYSKKCPRAVVFADPPWGGDEYGRVSTIDDLYLYSNSETAARAILGDVEVDRQQQQQQQQADASDSSTLTSQLLLKISVNRFVEYMLSCGHENSHSGDTDKVSAPMVILKLPTNYNEAALKAIPTRFTEINRSIHKNILFVALVGYDRKNRSNTSKETLINEDGVYTVQSHRQFREIWADTDLKKRLFSLVRGAQLFNCTEQQQIMDRRLTELVQESISRPEKCDDQYIYDQLHNLVHNVLFQSEEYKRVHPPQQVSENSFRTNSRIKQIHRILKPYIHESQQFTQYSSGRRDDTTGYRDMARSRSDAPSDRNRGGGLLGNAPQDNYRYGDRSSGGRSSRSSSYRSSYGDARRYDNRNRSDTQRGHSPKTEKLKIRSLLDVGCSEGAITEALGQSFNLSPKQTFGCDVRDVPTQDGFSFSLINEKTNKLPYEDRSMSIVTCLMCLHHIRNPKTTIREAYRVLEPGGILVIREHDNTPVSLSMFLDVMHGMYSLVWSKPREMPDFCSEYYARYLSKEQWNEVICKEGFEMFTEEVQVHSRYDDAKQIYQNAMRQYYALYRKAEKNK